MKPIYLDHAATTPLHPEVIKQMHLIMQTVFGNPSSIHAYGRKARQVMDEARRVIAESIHANEKDIYFTSGGTEADNLALIGTALANKHKGNHIITTEQEHHAVLHAAEYLEQNGFNITYLPVNENGLVSVESVKQSLTDETILVSVMYVNNETGMIQPIKEIAELLKDHQAYFHTDAVQAYGLIDIHVKDMHIDLLTTSAHKINGPKGIGFLYTAETVQISPLAFGGEQERKRRPGTENIVNVTGFQKAVELMLESKDKNRDMYEDYRTIFLDTLKAEDVSFSINGELRQAVPNIVNLSFPGIHVESFLTNLDLEGIAASSGSACTAGAVDPSHVLVAMYGQDDSRINQSIRFSFGRENNEENIKEAAQRIASIVKRLTK
ncbi:cysteine desulfurase [Cerasibacillus quisquiliarum]|uniref:cysteine desulfurase n=1 Tax=Cerasibacillus quisquiliarum TaxID=227865 RepID=A0A511UWM4_9BACI|nr:cysteine desulfurase family protein [Cerasibacillus quisquiliarum]MBB5145597.1 cysteine desulfurase [Cerasibacillus quisquiliarum]GEN31007.1 cysteine desulfurase [Cerasibacillus quisquiliarum]